MKNGLTLILTLCSLWVSGQMITFSQTVFSDFEGCKAQSYSAFLSYSKGHDLIYTGQYRRAITAFEQAAQKDPSFCSAFDNLAYCHLKFGETAKSKEYVINSLTLNSLNPSAYIIRGYHQINDSDYNAAVETFKVVVNSIPEEAHGYYGLSYALYLLQKYDSALINVKIAESKSDKLYYQVHKKLVLVLKGKILNKMGNEKGVPLIDPNLVKMIKDAEANYLVGQYYFNLELKSKAAKYLTRADELGHQIEAPMKSLVKRK